MEVFGKELACRDVSTLHLGRAAADKLPPYGLWTERKLNRSKNRYGFLL